MREHIEHTVMFFLDGDERPIVQGRGRGRYFRMDGVTVRLFQDRAATVWAGGIRCKKDGTDSTAWGRSSESLECPDPKVWISRAIDLVQK